MRLLAAFLLALAPAGIGQFHNQTDIGASAQPGSAEYDSGAGVYRVTGGGANIWGNADAFHFVWKRMSGDFTLTTDVEVLGTAEGNPHRKAGWMVRQTLEPDSPYADLVVHAAGLTSLQFRAEPGGLTEEVQAPVQSPRTIQLERRGDRFRMLVAREGEALREAGSKVVVLHDPVYVGLVVCSHDATRMETAVFSRVKIEAAPSQ